jgi:hypothetical protein
MAIQQPITATRSAQMFFSLAPDEIEHVRRHHRLVRRRRHAQVVAALHAHFATAEPALPTAAV